MASSTWFIPLEKHFYNARKLGLKDKAMFFVSGRHFRTHNDGEHVGDETQYQVRYDVDDEDMNIVYTTVKGKSK